MSLRVACAADSAFVPHCAAMLHSLLEVHREEGVVVHFLHDEMLPAAELGPLGDMVAALGGEWRPLPVPAEWRSRLPDNRRFGRVAWYRVFLPELLSQQPRVLYLDADTIIVDRLDNLWRTALDDQPVAAVANPLYPTMDRSFLTPLGIETAGYFNSGVLLFNLDVWRQENLTDRVLDAGASLGRQEWPDQNALNLVLRDRWVRLAPRWNTQNTVFDLPARRLPFTRAEVVAARKRPAVLHFIGPYKPWHYRCKHRFLGTYWQHLRQTPWAQRSVEGRTLKHRLLRLLPERWGWYLEAQLRRLQRWRTSRI